MSAWMLWATAVTLLLGLAALALEHCLRLLRRPRRLAWVGAACGATALTATALLRPGAVRQPVPGGVELRTADLLRDLAAAVPAAPGVLERIDAALPWAWAFASALLVVGMAGGLWRLARQARRWPSALVASERVLVSDGFGPALIGVLTPRIVLPRWALHMGSERLRMACLHEAEHRRTRDGLVLFGSALLTAAAPWNPALWWIHARLRAAVEMDCDARVLRAGAPRAAYGSLLLELSTRTRDVPLAVAAFARPRATLERRMMMIVRDEVTKGLPAHARVAAGLAIAGLAVAAACSAPAPTTLGTDAPEAYLEAKSAEGAGTEVSLLRERAPSDLVGEGRVRLKRSSADGSDGPTPLIFIDGVRVDGDAAALDALEPSAIERIEVLKGAAAAGLYGDEGAGGVIQVFLKPAERR